MLTRKKFSPHHGRRWTNVDGDLRKAYASAACLCSATALEGARPRLLDFTRIWWCADCGAAAATDAAGTGEKAGKPVKIQHSAALCWR